MAQSVQIRVLENYASFRSTSASKASERILN